MGRTVSVPRPALLPPVPAHLRPVVPPSRRQRLRTVRSRTGQAFAVVLASLVLLLCGTVEVLPRSAAAAATSTSATAAGTGSAGAAAASRGPRAGSLEAPTSSVSGRTVGLAGVPAPSGPGSGLAPAPGPLVAPHLVAVPQSRPPTAPPAASRAGARGSRAPPGPAGT